MQEIKWCTDRSATLELARRVSIRCIFGGVLVWIVLHNLYHSFMHMPEVMVERCLRPIKRCKLQRHSDYSQVFFSRDREKWCEVDVSLNEGVWCEQGFRCFYQKRECKNCNKNIGTFTWVLIAAYCSTKFCPTTVSVLLRLLDPKDQSIEEALFTTWNV